MLPAHERTESIKMPSDRPGILTSPIDGHSALFACSALPDLRRRLHRCHVFFGGIQPNPARPTDGNPDSPPARTESDSAVPLRPVDSSIPGDDGGFQRPKFCLKCGERSDSLLSDIHGPDLFTTMPTTIVITKAAICGWLGQIALETPKNHTPIPAAVAISVAARVLPIEVFMRSEIPQF